MRPIFCLLLLLGAVVRAQETPKPEEPATGTAPPPPMEGSLSGSDAGTKHKSDPTLLRPAKTAAPAASAYPTQYLLYVAEAMKSFQARNFEGALSYADRADALIPPTVWTLNVRGAVAIEQHKYEEGEKLCREALKLDPSFFPARFNLSEIPFLQGNYALARAGWGALYSKISPDDPTVELLIYRIYLTYLLEKDMVRAKEWLGKLPFPSQTPAYQYAHAAWERQNGSMEKWNEWIQSAEFIWPLSKRSAFSDVLLQLKWLKQESF